MGQADTDCPMIKRALRAFFNSACHPAIGMVVVAAFAFDVPIPTPTARQGR